MQNQAAERLSLFKRFRSMRGPAFFPSQGHRPLDVNLPAGEEGLHKSVHFSFQDPKGDEEVH